MLSKQIIKSGQIIQLTCQSNVDGNVYYVIGKRFDKKCIYLVEQKEVQNVSNFDNSFFEVERSQSINNKSNNKLEGEKDNKPIKFGDQIKFKHINSGKYLSVARQYTERSKGSFKILLTEGIKPSEITFQIMPYRTFEKSADQIKYKAKVNIYNQQEEVFLNIQKNLKDQNDKKTKALIATHMPDSQWEINLYSVSFNPVSDVIRDKDLVYMVDSKSSGLLTFAKNYKEVENKNANKQKAVEEKQTVYRFIMKELPKTYPIKKQPKSFDCIWQISIKTGDYAESDEMGKKRQQLKISFTHLIQQTQGFKNLITKLISSQEGNYKNSLMRKGQGDTITSGQYIRIGNKNAKNQIKSMVAWLGDNSKNNKLLDRQGSKRHKNKLYKQLTYTQNQGESIVFQIVRIPEDLKKQIYEYIEAKQRIQSFINSLSIIIQKQQEEQQQSLQEQLDRFKQAEQILKHISQSLEPEKNQKDKVLQRQMILNDIGFINLIMQCLQKLTDKDNRVGQRTEQSKDLRKKFNDVLKHCCKGNKQIKLALSNQQHLLQLLKPSSIQDDNNDIQPLNQIMQDNKYAIEHVMNHKLVKEIINQFQRKTMQIQVFTRYMQILRLICKTSNQVIPRNQKLVIQELLERRSIKKQQIEKPPLIDFFFKVNEDKEVNVITPQARRLGDNKVLSEANEPIYYFFTHKDHQQQYQACLEWIDLISDVCQNKNVQGKKFAQERFGTRVIEAFLYLPPTKLSQDTLTPDYFFLRSNHGTIEELKSNVKFCVLSSIVRLCNNAYIKTIYRHKIFFDRIFIQKQNMEENILLYPETILPGEEDFIKKIKQFLNKYTEALIKYLVGLRQVSDTPPEGEYKLYETTKNVFMLMKNMIMYGLYNPSENPSKQNKNYKKQLNNKDNDSKRIENTDILAAISHIIRQQKGFMNNFLTILSQQSDALWKPQILEIINFYMNLDLRQRVDNTIRQIKLKIKQIYQRTNRSINLQKAESKKKQLKADRNKQMISECQRIIEQYKPKNITQRQIKIFIIIMLSSFKNENIKDKNNFILSLNTLSKFIEVKRIYSIRVKQTLIVNNNHQEQKDKLETIRKARDCFQICEIKDLKGISLKDQYQLSIPIWDKNGDSIIKFILTITQNMKDGGNKQAKIDDIFKNTWNSKNLISAYNELQKPNPKIQKMVREMKLHRYFYSFIKQMNSEVEEQLSNKLLEIIYLCLAVFTWKNYQNKTELSQLFPYMLEHAEHNNGSIEALKQFFSQNPSILYDEQKITKVTEKITNYIDFKTQQSICKYKEKNPHINMRDLKQVKNDSVFLQLSYNFYYAAKLLDFLHSLIAADSSKQGRNRILVLSYILDKDRIKITMPEIIQTIIIHKKPENLKDFHSSQITYLSVLFGLLAQLVDQESINIAKCKKLHKLQVLVEIMSKMKNDVRLKASTRDYVNKLYYVSMDNSYNQLILNTQLATFKYDLEEYIYHRIVVIGKEEKYYCREREQKYRNGLEKVKTVYAGFQKMNSRNHLRLLKSGDFKSESNEEKNKNQTYDNPVRYTYKSTYFYLNLERIVSSLELILSSKDLFTEENKKINDYQAVKHIIELYRRLRFICINFFYDDLAFKERIRKILNILDSYITSQNKTKKIYNTDLRIEKKSSRLNSDKTDDRPYEIKFFEKEDPKQLNLIDELREPQLQKIEQNDKKKQPQEDIEKIKMDNYMAINRIVQTMLRPISTVQIKQQTLEEIEKNIISQLKYQDRQQKQEAESKQNRQMKQQKDNNQQDKEQKKDKRQKKDNLYSIYQDILAPDIKKSTIQNQLQSVFKCINMVIAKHYEIFQAKNLTFYFRTVLKQLQKLSDDCLKKLTDSFSQLMFTIITSCNLQQNIEVSYQFFQFAANYWDKIKSSKTQPDRLYKLIKEDNKNQFLIKLNDFIVFLSNDIYRKVGYDESSRETPLKIFDTEIQSFVEIKSLQYGELNKQIQNKRIFKTFKNIFQFMQLLCENNFVAFKSQFRQQKIERSIKPNNRNLLIRSTIELRKLFRMYNNVIQDLPEQILDFINQIAQIPCYDNQIELSKSTFFEEMCNFIDQKNKQLNNRIQRYPDKKFTESEIKYYSHIQNIIEKFFKILLSLLESNMHQIYQSLLQKLSPNFFQQVTNIHKNSPCNTDKDRYNPESKIGKLKINMLIIRKQLDIKSLKVNDLLGSLKDLTIQIPGDRYSINNIESIEVRLDDKQHKLYFFKPVEAEGVDKDNQFIRTIQQKLDRSTHLQKLDSLLLQRKSIQMFMVYQHNSRNQSYKIIYKFISLNTYASIVSVLINIIIMLTTSINIVGDNINSQQQKILLPLQIIQFILGTLFFFSDAFDHIMKARFDKFNFSRKQNKVKLDYGFAELDLSGWIGVIKSTIPSIIYYLVCVLGLFVSPYYYSVHILFLFAKIKVLENVFKAITYNIYQLVYLALLGIAFFIVFSILSIDTYAPYAQEQYCNSVWQCSLVIYNKDLFIQQSQNTQTNIYSLLFEILYSVFFGALFGNIISGLMTDTFAQLRDKQNYITQDESNYCYICGRSRFEIERENKDKLKLADIYEKHTAKHNKLSYVFYIYELEKKEKTEYTGLEYIISKRVEENSVVWFPIKKKEENQNINEIKKELEKLDEMLG